MSDRRLEHGASIKPVDHDSGLDDEEQHSLWPAFAYVSSRLAGGYREAVPAADLPR